VAAVALLESLSSPERVPISGGIFYTPHHSIEHTRSRVTIKVVFDIFPVLWRYIFSIHLHPYYALWLHREACSPYNS
jgi:hypothetical protein